MPRPRKSAKKEADLEEEEEEEEELDLPPTIEPYKVLGLEKTATDDNIKKAYRKAALKHHPDKADSASKDTAHTKFQEIAFAYAVLSDPLRRKRYDATGSTSESISADGDFNWAEFYSSQFRDVVTAEAIETFAKAYKGSEEEKDDLLEAYTQGKGKWDKIYEMVMLSDPLEDEARFRIILDTAIEEGEVKGFKAYVNETEKQKTKRLNAARAEGAEAEEYAKELGVHDQLFGKEKKKKKGGSGEDALMAMIQQRQADRGSMLDRMEAKYTAIETEKKAKKKGKGKGKRASPEDEEEDIGEPSEEAFQAAAARLKKAKDAESGEGRKAKKVKR